MDSFLKKFVFNFIELETAKDDESAEQMHSNRITNSDSQHVAMRGFELIFKLFEHMTIQDWLKIQRSLHNLQGFHHQKGQLIDLDINTKIIDAVQVINENSLNTICLATNEKTQLQGIISTQDILNFLVKNYKGDIDFFQHYFSTFEAATNSTQHTSRN